MKKTALLILMAVVAPAFSRAMDPSLVLRVSTPLIFSLEGNLRFGEGEGYHPLISGEAGIGGGKVAAGLASAGDTFGLALKAAFLQTWGEPVDVDEDQSFLGLEGEWSIKRMVLSVGGYRRVSSGDDDWLGSAGIGFIF